VAGPVAWNSIPAAFRDADTVSSFKRRLKTHFFLCALTMLDFDFCNALPVRARVGSGTITAIYYYHYYYACNRGPNRNSCINTSSDSGWEFSVGKSFVLPSPSLGCPNTRAHSLYSHTRANVCLHSLLVTIIMKSPIFLKACDRPIAKRVDGYRIRCVNVTHQMAAHSYLQRRPVNCAQVALLLISVNDRHLSSIGNWYLFLFHSRILKTKQRMKLV